MDVPEGGSDVQKLIQTYPILINFNNVISAHNNFPSDVLLAFLRQYESTQAEDNCISAANPTMALC